MWRNLLWKSCRFQHQTMSDCIGLNFEAPNVRVPERRLYVHDCTYVWDLGPLQNKLFLSGAGRRGDCGLGRGEVSIQMEDSGSWTAWEQAAERGRNYYNSGVTRDMSNTGHMGFTAKGLWGNGHRLQPRGEVRLMVLQPNMSWSQRKDRAISLHLGLATGDSRWKLQVIVGAANTTAAALCPSVCLRICGSVCLSGGFQTDLAEIRSD